MITLGIADDEPDIRKLFKMVLGRNGYHIAYMACSGDEAVAMQRKSPADIIFMDYGMPHMDGMDAAKEILGEFPRTRIFLMTCGEDVADRLKGMGRVTVLKKPFPFRSVIEMLDGAGGH